MRLRLFLDRWQQGRFVEFSQRERSGVHYHPRFGTEFGIDVLLTCQGAPSLMRWRGMPLMKNVFDFAMYPVLIAELRPRTVFEDRLRPGRQRHLVRRQSGDSAASTAGSIRSIWSRSRANIRASTSIRAIAPIPQRLFDPDLLRSAPHPWLVVEDAHHNVAAVLEQFHEFLVPGDYLVVEDSDVKREALRKFSATIPATIWWTRGSPIISAATPPAPPIRYLFEQMPEQMPMQPRARDASGNSAQHYPADGERKLTRLNCASRAVTDNDADRLFCKVRICSPI